MAVATVLSAATAVAAIVTITVIIALFSISCNHLHYYLLSIKWQMHFSAYASELHICMAVTCSHSADQCVVFMGGRHSLNSPTPIFYGGGEVSSVRPIGQSTWHAHASNTHVHLSAPHFLMHHPWVSNFFLSKYDLANSGKDGNPCLVGMKPKESLMEV